jgi:hypothetical protein
MYDGPQLHDPTPREMAARGQAADQDAYRRRPTGLDTFDGRDHYRENRRTVFIFLLIMAAVIAKITGFW